MTKLNFNNLELGHKSNYLLNYSPQILQPIPRSLNRESLGITNNVPFLGFDVWNLYEISFLNKNGKPIVAVGTLKIPANSKNIVESKSLKLYLNSLNFTQYKDVLEVQNIIKNDLSNILETSVEVNILPLNNVTIKNNNFEIWYPIGVCLDDLDIAVSKYDYSTIELVNSTTNEDIEESLYSNLMKSNCLVTGQPDWGTIFIKYQGKQIIKEKLLKYIISFRNHNEFHEMCVERIFCDILNFCNPKKLTVYARYTRRGGIDINPFRSNFENEPIFFRTIRQ